MKTFKQFLYEVHLELPEGSLTYTWKDDLEDEEHEGYIPKGYSKKVLELGGVYSNETGKGQGDALMKKFLASKDAKKAELIFLDPVPGLGHFYSGSGGANDQKQIQTLQKFYRKYGFRNRPGHNRMWLVQKGSIPDSELPT
jgi:hypothetical protein